MRRLLLVGVLIALALSAAGAASPAGTGQARWVITDLGKNCYLVAINERGQVTGSCWKGRKHQAFLWQNGKMTDLGTLADDLVTEPAAINERGQIVGRAVRYGPVGNTDGPVKSFGFLWQNGRITKLGTLGGERSGATAINDRGQIIGGGTTKNGSGHAILWEKGHLTDVGGDRSLYAVNNYGQVIGGPGFLSGQGFLWANGKHRDIAISPRAINERGQVAGAIEATGPPPHGTPRRAALWEHGRTVDLGSLGGLSAASALNERGMIVGFSQTASGDFHIVLWENGRMIDLANLGGKTGPGYGAREIAINDRGQILAIRYRTRAPFSREAVVWEKGRIAVLPTLGGESDAFAINNRGQIIGASTTKNGDTHAVLWTLRPGS